MKTDKCVTGNSLVSCTKFTACHVGIPLYRGALGGAPGEIRLQIFFLTEKFRRLTYSLSSCKNLKLDIRNFLTNTVRNRIKQKEGSVLSRSPSSPCLHFVQANSDMAATFDYPRKPQTGLSLPACSQCLLPATWEPALAGCFRWCRQGESATHKFPDGNFVSPQLAIFALAPPNKNIAALFDSPTNMQKCMFLSSLIKIRCGQGESNSRLTHGKGVFYH